MSFQRVSSAETNTRVRQKVTAQTLLEKKHKGEAISALTAYDYPTGRLVDEAGVDIVLVGDSLAMTVLGHSDTLSVTMDEMLHHTKAVRRGVQHALLLADMPYGSFHVSTTETVRNALRFMKEAGAEAVKIEGGKRRSGLVERLTLEEVPVVGHIGLTPQSLHRMGGYKVQGRSLPAMEELLNDAIALEGAGAIAIVLEGIPRELAAEITATLKIPTIGIGAGPDCDGQVLVFHDAFRSGFSSPPKFVRSFANVEGLLRKGVEDYCAAVAAHSFPADNESYHLPREVAAAYEPAHAAKAFAS